MGERTFRKALMFPLIAFIMLLPSGVLTGALSILQVALCGGDPAAGIESTINWEAYCKEYPEGEQPLWVTLIQKVLLTWLPPVLLMLWQIVLMRVLYYIAAAEGRNIALSMIDRRIISLYFYWDFFNVFLGGVIGSAGITLLVQNFGKLAWTQCSTYSAGPSCRTAISSSLTCHCVPSSLSPSSSCSPIRRCSAGRSGTCSQKLTAARCGAT